MGFLLLPQQSCTQLSMLLPVPALWELIRILIFNIALFLIRTCFFFFFIVLNYLRVVWDSVSLSSKRQNIKNGGRGGIRAIMIRKRGWCRSCKIWAASSVAIATLIVRFGLPSVMLSCLNWDYGYNDQKEYTKKNRWILIALHFFDSFLETLLRDRRENSSLKV